MPRTPETGRSTPAAPGAHAAAQARNGLVPVAAALVLLSVVVAAIGEFLRVPAPT